MALFKKPQEPVSAPVSHEVPAEVLTEKTPVIKEQKEPGAYLAVPKTVKLDYAEDGVYMYIEGSAALSVMEKEAVMRHLTRRKLEDTDAGAIEAVMSGAPRAKIASAQMRRVYGEELVVDITDDLQCAYITLLPCDTEGGRRLSANDIIMELASKYRVSFGIDREEVARIVDERIYDAKIAVARGTLPVNGTDGYLEFHFDTREDGAVNRMRQVGEDEKADFKNLDLFERVTKDQLLVTKHLPIEGRAGMNVIGQSVPPLPGKLYNLPIGKNTYASDDKLKLHAQTGGSVEYANGTVRVSNCYVIDKNVDLSVGNIDFDGDVRVNGNVLAGYNIKATGSVEVKGVVEACTIEADGDIFIRGGIQGAGKGSLISNGSVFVKFAENATVKAHDMVVAESLLHSNVSCFGAIEVINGRGCIIGGNTCACVYIAAQLIGNASGRSTYLEVGASPVFRAKLLELEEEYAALSADVEKLSAAAQKPSQPNEPPKLKAYRMEVMKVLLVQSKLRDACAEEIAEMKNQLQEMKNGQVHVMKEAFQGTSITIGIASYILERPSKFATFRLREHDVEITNCRFMPQPIRPRIRRR